jgi:CheY-like chemotaxis protein
MERNAPIRCIGNNPEELAILKEMALAMQLTDEVVLFDDPDAALGYLTDVTTEPRFILCETNMPVMNGFALRKLLLWTDTPAREAPFVFLSGSRCVPDLTLAKSLQVRAFFARMPGLASLKAMLQIIQRELNGLWSARLPLI